MADRARVYQAEGIILRRRNLGEADSVFTVFSDELGKFEAVARGVRKARSHMRGHLEPLTRTRMQLARGRSLDVFTQAETVAAYRAVRDDLERMGAAIYCAELVDRFTLEHAEHPGLFDLLAATFEALDAGAALQVVRYFELHLLDLTGYSVVLDACAHCGARLPEAETLFSPAAGGLVCANCRGTAGAGRLLSVRAVKVLRYGQGCDLAAFSALRTDGALAAELLASMADAVRYVLEREPLSGRYLEDLARLPPASAAQSSTGPGSVARA